MSEWRKRMVLTLAAMASLAMASRAGAQAGSAEPAPQAQGAAPAQPGQAAEAAAPKKAEQAFKNIQVLKGIPADQLIPAMQFISNSLGVECGYCHVEHAFDKDDKLPKKTARKMMTMMFAINHDNFKDQRVVSCYSCHHGSKAPVAIPIIAEEEPKPEPGAPGMPGAPGATPAALPALPPVNSLVDKYVAALGGVDAIQKITSRGEKGTLSGFGGHQFPIEVYSKAPDKRLSVMHLPNGESLTAYDGRQGWLGGGDRPPREVTGPELELMKLDSDFYFPAHLKEEFSQLRPARPEKVGDAEAYVVMGIKPGQPPVKLYFDEQSGLLVRMVEYVDTPVGRNPTEINYADYRDSGGVKVPFRWTIARPLGRFTIQVDQMEQNVPIDDAKFAMPPAPTAPPAGHP